MGSVATPTASQARQRSTVATPIRVNPRFAFLRLHSRSLFVSIRGWYSRLLFRPIRMALPADYARLTEMNYQDPPLGPRAVKGNKLLGFA